MVRITDEKGDNLDDLVVNADRTLPASGSTYLTGVVPRAGAGHAAAVDLPKFRKPCRSFTTGRE